MERTEKNTSWSVYYWILILFFIISIGGIFFSSHFSNFMLTSKRAIEEKQFSEKIIKLYQNKNYQALLPYYGKFVNKDNQTKVSNLLNTNFSSDTPTSVKLVGLGYIEDVSSKDTARINTTLEYQFDKRWFLAGMLFSKKGSDKTLMGIHILRLPKSLEQINEVSLLHASLKQYSALILFIILPIIVLWSLIKCIRTPNLKRKWLWVLFIIFGFCNFQFNWTAQKFIFHPVSFQLFSVSYFRYSIYAPLIMSFAIPVGAILFLIKAYYKSQLNERKSRS